MSETFRYAYCFDRGIFRYAYCFDHGDMHFFRADEEPWCTATWVWLDVETAVAAFAEKTKRYGDARFLDQLPLDQQVTVIEQTRQRREGREGSA